MQRALLMTGFTMLLAAAFAHPALAAGMMPPANLLPPGYVPMAAAVPLPLPMSAPAADDAERSGTGEADLASTDMQMEEPAVALAPAPAQSQPAPEYIDMPALAPLPQMAEPMAAPQAPLPQASANPAYYTQGITTGPKAYNEGNFVFKR